MNLKSKIVYNQRALKNQKKVQNTMNFQSYSQLIEAIKYHPEFSNEIKFKRLKKQLQILSNYQNPTTSIQTISLTSVGIELLIINKYRQSSYQYKMLLDFEYPFNRPIIFYMKNDSQYAQCKDLLDLLLQSSNWGPSLMISYFLDRIQTISEIIQQNRVYESQLLYHLNQNYLKSFLQQMNIKLFSVDEYTWKFLVKSTKKRFIGLTKQTFLVFSASKTSNNLLLNFWTPISKLTAAKASVSDQNKFNLEISFAESEKEAKMYFGGQGNVEEILGYLNPIEMIQRKVQQIQIIPNFSQKCKKENYWQDSAQMVREFTQLIEHYSLINSVKANKYIKLMKELISAFYDEPSEVPNKIQIQKKQGQE